MAKGKQTNNDPPQKIEDRATQSQLKPGVNPGVPQRAVTNIHSFGIKHIVLYCNKKSLCIISKVQREQ